MLLRGSSRTGSRVHAVASLERDPNPLDHSHGQSRPALCGAVVRPKQHRWNPRVANACARCTAIASTEETS